MDKISKEARARFINVSLDKAGVPNWGRAGLIREKTGCSPATASGWLTGSLPKDPVSLFNFSDEYNFCPYEWVFGVPRVDGSGFNHSRVQLLISKLKQFELGTEKMLTADQFSKLFMLLLRSEEKASYLLEHGDILMDVNN
tara:strand:+ start:1891 stop:2313 length:423 start_codon:yes stop_codon:yes gene_type:complete